jgi:NADPH:quinone reductase-like Zn-dependent oxidoreductase
VKALLFEKTGSLDDVKITEVPKPVPGAGEVLIQVKAAAINPSDVKNILGKMHETSTPRVPGRDFAGIVVEGPEQMINQPVFGAGGNLGFGRDGTHAEFVAVPIAAINPLPKNLEFSQAAAMGVGYLTAWTAVVTAAQIQPGEIILITGATGSVGSAAARIARNHGAHVIGTTRKASDIANLRDSGCDDWIGLDAGDLSTSVLSKTSGRGADVILDTVGGPLFEPCLKSLARRGRQVAISSGRDPVVSFNLVDFYHRGAHLIGVDSLKLSFAEASEILRALTPGIENGTYPPPAIQLRRFADALEAYRLLSEGKVKEKQILVPS